MIEFKTIEQNGENCETFTQVYKNGEMIYITQTEMSDNLGKSLDVVILNTKQWRIITEYLVSVSAT